MKVSQAVHVSLTANRQYFADKLMRARAHSTEARAPSESNTALDDDSEDTSKIADNIDAAIYEELIHHTKKVVTYPNQDCTRTPSPAQAQAVDGDLPPPGPTSLPICPEGGDRQPFPQLVVDHFALGHTGAPIPGALPEPSPYHNFPEQGTSEWAPFSSQCDWGVAHWAKIHSITASAVDALLAIPEVRTLNMC